MTPEPGAARTPRGSVLAPLPNPHADGTLAP